jgi:hypothetical protein
VTVQDGTQPRLRGSESLGETEGLEGGTHIQHKQDLKMHSRYSLGLSTGVSTLELAFCADSMPSLCGIHPCDGLRPQPTTVNTSLLKLGGSPPPLHDLACEGGEMLDGFG